MKMQMFSVYDTASGLFARPIFAQSRGIAIRSFSDEVNRQAADNTLYQHPEDFQLFHLGVYDDQTGVCESLDKPLRVVTASEVKLDNGK